MSNIVNFRNGASVEYWDTNDIADYCNLPFKKADRLHMLANKEYNVKGYGDIEKDDFLEFLAKIEAAKESQRLADESNAANIIYAQKNFRLSQFSLFVSQALSLLTSH